MKSNLNGICKYLIIGWVLLVIGALTGVTFDYGILCGVIGAWLFIRYLGGSLGMLSYRGTPSKPAYSVSRYIIGGILLLLFIVQCIFYFNKYINNPLEVISNRLFAWTADLSLIAYVFSFQPSRSSVPKKIFKILGFSIILLSLFVLPQIRQEYTYLTFWGTQTTEISYNYMAIVLGTFMFGIGLFLTYLGHRKKEEVKIDTSSDMSLADV